MPPLPQQLMTVMLCPLSATGATLKLILAFQRGEDARIFSWNSEHDVLFVLRPWSERHQDGVSPTNGSDHLQSRSISSPHRCQPWTCCLSGKRNPRNLFLTTGTDIRRSGHRLTLTEGLLLFWWCWSVCVAFKDHPFFPLPIVLNTSAVRLFPTSGPWDWFCRGSHNDQKCQAWGNYIRKDTFRNWPFRRILSLILAVKVRSSVDSQQVWTTAWLLIVHQKQLQKYNQF